MAISRAEIISLVSPQPDYCKPDGIQVKVNKSSVEIYFLDLPEDVYDDEAEDITYDIGKLLNTYSHGIISETGEYQFMSEHSLLMRFVCN